jgi:diacylglycerol kinase family enzyme
VPAGTLNHLASDVGLTEVDAAIAAVRRGRVVRMTLAELDGRVFVNAASLGLYPVLVTAREQLESRIGKWPAALLTAVRLLMTEVPTQIELDGRRRSVWLLLVGNGRFVNEGLSPRRRDRIDEPVLDVRVVGAEGPWARTRLAAAALTGRLARSPVYERWTAQTVRVRSLQGPLQLAKDGESWKGSSEPDARVHGRSLLLLLPPLPEADT